MWTDPKNVELGIAEIDILWVEFDETQTKVDPILNLSTNLCMISGIHYKQLEIYEIVTQIW